VLKGGVTMVLPNWIRYWGPSIGPDAPFLFTNGNKGLEKAYENTKKAFIATVKSMTFKPIGKL